MRGSTDTAWFGWALAAARDWLKSEIDKWQPVIRKAGVYAD